MGSCVMGFDASSINGNALEAEIRRVVQVIEQYPKPGRRCSSWCCASSRNSSPAT
jgi:hypothetical protein